MQKKYLLVNGVSADRAIEMYTSQLCKSLMSGLDPQELENLRGLTQ